MSDAPTSVETSCKQIYTAIGRPWEWDGRFGAVLLTYTKEEEGPVDAGVGAVFTSTVTSADVGGAPDNIKALIDDLGGLRAGQKIMHSDAAGEFVLYGVFWPWGGGGTISLRIGILAAGGDEAAAVAQLKTAFAVE